MPDILKWMMKDNHNTALNGKDLSRIEAARDILIENVDATRVNNSRTRLNKSIVTNALGLLNKPDFDESRLFSEAAIDEMFNILREPLRTLKSEVAPVKVKMR